MPFAMSNVDNSWVFDHVGIIVRSLAIGSSVYDAIFPNMRWTAPIDDPINGVRIQFGRDDANMVHELLEPLGDESPVAAALNAKRDITNHLAYRVSDLTAASQHMRAAKCIPTAMPKPAIAYGGCNIQFFLTPINSIIELIEAPNHMHHFL